MDRDAIEIFKERFLKIKSLGYVKSRRHHDTGIGKTFEDLMVIDENNRPIPDFMGLEIKTQRFQSVSYITLTTKSPDYPHNANNYLVSNYGYEDAHFSHINILHTSMFHNKHNTCKGTWGFRLEVDKKQEKIFIRIKDCSTNKIEPNEIYYEFKTLENIIVNKLQNIVYITAQKRKTEYGEEFFYTKATLLTGINLDKIITLIESDIIMYDIRIGVYRSGPNLGKPHDHGSGFRIKRDNLNKLFAIEMIE